MIYLLFSAFYWNAWRQRKNLHLNPLEITLTLASLLSTMGLCIIGLLCCLLARILPPAYAGDACYVFLLALLSFFTACLLCATITWCVFCLLYTSRCV